MAVAEHREAIWVLDALGVEERRAGGRFFQDAAAEPEPLKGGAHLVVEVALKVGRALRVLALGRDRDLRGEVGLEGPRVEMVERVRDRGVAAHGAPRASGAIASRRPSPTRLIAKMSSASPKPGMAMSQNEKNM
jgi:hypothetical protein